MKVDLPTPESPSSRIGTTGASLMGVMASAVVVVPSALIAAAIAIDVLFCLAWIEGKSSQTDAFATTSI